MTEKNICLATLREQIDFIDKELIRLFCERMDITAQVAEYKRANSLPVLDTSREQDKLAVIEQLAGEAYSEYCKTLYREIFSLSRSHQEKLLSSGTHDSESRES